MKVTKTQFLKTIPAIILVTLLISVAPIQAADYTVGVKQGDWIKYGEFHASTTGTATGLSQIAEMDNIDWMKMEVKSVTSTEVTVETTGAYKNGTTTPATPATEIDIASGSGSTGYFILLIGADLEEGDDVVPQQQGGFALKLNGTTTRAYAGAMRSVNYLDFTVSMSGTTVTAKWYWDKATGVMMETFTSMSTTTPTAASMELSLKAVETNMWSADVLGTLLSNPIYIAGIVIVVVIVIVAAGFLIFRRRKPTVSAPSATPAPPTPTEETKPT